MSECQCFTCKYYDNPKLKKAYCIGYVEACEWFLNWAQENNIQIGSISDDDLGGIYAQIKCNYDETKCYMADLPDLDADFDDSKQDMYVFSLRYCLGRSTLSVITCIDEIRKNIKEFSKRVLHVMINDIEEFLSKYLIDTYLDKNSKSEGFPEYIISAWESLLLQLKSEANK